MLVSLRPLYLMVCHIFKVYNKYVNMPRKYYYHRLTHDTVRKRQQNTVIKTHVNSLESKIQFFYLPYMILARSFDACLGRYMLVVYSPGGCIKN